MSTASIMKYMRENQLPEKAKTEKVVNPNRVVSDDGRFFLQPTGGKNGSAFKFHYCYVGIKSKSGEFLTGFSMDNVKLLQLVDEKVLPKDIATVFEKYASTHHDQMVIKIKE